MAEAATALWNEGLLRDPHAVADKRQRVQGMFAAIAPSYDLNNRLHSLWMDQRWRKAAVRLSGLRAGDVVVDVACGTGDLALKYAAALEKLRGAPDALRNREAPGQRAIAPEAAPALPAAAAGADREAASDLPRVIGVDFTFPMLAVAREKTARGGGPPGGGKRAAGPMWVNGDAMRLPLPDECADVVSIAFGIRNVASPPAAFREFHRILRPGGRLVLLEFATPTQPLLRQAYNFYFQRILPLTATWISGDRTGAYKYLPRSVDAFSSPAQLQAQLRAAGFLRTELFGLTFGVCMCHRAVK